MSSLAQQRDDILHRIQNAKRRKIGTRALDQQLSEVTHKLLRRNDRRKARKS